MKQQMIGLVLLMLLIVLTACSDKESSYSYPLKVGNTWTYQRIMTEEPTKTTHIDTIYVTVDSTLVTPNGESCYRLRFKVMEMEQEYIYYQYLVNRNDGLYSVAGGGSFQIKNGQNQAPIFPLFAAGVKASKDDEDVAWFEMPHLLLPSNPKPGYSWIQPANSDWAEVHYEIQDRETVQTDLGSFKCYVKRSEVLIDPENPYSLYDYYGSYGLIKFLYEGEMQVWDPEAEEYVPNLVTDEVRLIASDLN
jgi:hypothetical protein